MGYLSWEMPSKVDKRRQAVKLLEDRFDRERISNDLRHDNVEAFIKIQDDQIAALKTLLAKLGASVEQLEVEVKVNPLKKLMKHYNLFM